MEIIHMYLCDGEACNGPCHKECHYTTDETHAKNKIRRKFKITKNGGRIIMWEE